MRIRREWTLNEIVGEFQRRLAEERLQAEEFARESFERAWAEPPL